jgi:MFS family permease
MFAWLSWRLGLTALGRREDLDDRATVLALFARFTDEVASGLLIVLTPTLRARLGLTVVQVGWCFQALFTVAAVVEPVSGAALDLVRRKPYLVWGAAGWAASLLVAAGAPSFGWLLAAFALAGAASGPLAHTGDVVLVEAHPGAVERIQGRSTLIDTVGALLAPSAVAVAGWIAVDERLVLALAGGATLGYAALLAGSVLPAPAIRADGSRAIARVVANVRRVVADRAGRRWLLALLIHELLDLPELFEPIWLREVVGISQSLVAVHVALGLVATLVGLVLLDRWLAGRDAGALLVASLSATAVLYPLWLLTPGVLVRFLLVVPRNLVMAPLWPILRSRALAATPGTAGTVSAISSLTGLVPLAAAFSWAAGRLGLTTAMLVVTLGAAAVLFAVLGRRSADPGRAQRTR